MQDRDVPEIKNEPMLFNCDFQGAAGQGGPLTLEFLSLLPAGWQEVPIVVDSRVHMLMPGWYPCIPGWHHDDVPRTRSDGQPNYGPGQFRSEHITALVNGDVCPTLFALGRSRFLEPPIGSVVYEQWHHEVQRRIWEGVLDQHPAPSNRLIWFDDRTWHRGQSAISNGWRFFIRASRYYGPDGNPVPRGNPRTNEVRRQVQVYLENVNAGW
jgi:hypothetical protein